MIDIVELTKRFGLQAHEQSAVAAWTGDKYGTTWTEAEAQELLEVWEAEKARAFEADNARQFEEREAYLNYQADTAW